MWKFNTLIHTAVVICGTGRFLDLISLLMLDELRNITFFAFFGRSVSILAVVFFSPGGSVD